MAYPEASAGETAGSVPILSYRPIVALASDRIEAFECAEHAATAASFPVESSYSPCGALVRRAIDDLVAFTVADLLISLPANALIGGLLNDEIWAELRYALSRGGRLTILVGWPHNGIEITPISAMLARFRQFGCDVGIDNFGFAPVPLLWPAIHRLDAVRLDARMMSLIGRGDMDMGLVENALQMLRHSKVQTIILDGCVD